MEISEMVPALLGGMSIAAVVLLGVRLMLGPNEKRYENAPVEPRDAITSARGSTNWTRDCATSK